MNPNGTPVLDPRNAEQVFRELLARRPAYVPELVPAEDRPVWALLQIFARYMGTVIDRLNQAPDKNLLAFLDMLAIGLIPARGARAPVVFLPLPTGVDGRVPAGTQIGAEVPGRADPLMFETENAIAMAAAHLVEVATLWPVRDEYADHTTEFAGSRPFTLFNDRRRVPHELYIAHGTLFSFASDATVKIEFELATPGSAPLDIVWEHWDGQVWRPFKAFDVAEGLPSQDGTKGLTRSGVVTLRAECGESQKTTVNGIEAHWVRGRLAEPLAPDPARVLPEVDRVRLRSSIERPAFTWRVNQANIGGELAIDAIVKDEDGMPFSAVTIQLKKEGASHFTRGETATDGHLRFSSNVEPNRLYSLEVRFPAPPYIKTDLPLEASALQVSFILSRGLSPDQAFADGLRLDVSKTFFPLGQQPQPGSTFYFSSKEIFSKPGAVMMVWIEILQRDLPLLDTPNVAWEYWNGHRWTSVSLEILESLGSAEKEDLPRFTGDGVFMINVPKDMVPTEVNGQEGFWMRGRLTSGGYAVERDVPGTDFKFEETVPPAIADFRLGYAYRSPWEQPEHLLTYNDFQFALHSRNVRVPGRFFQPFRPVADTTPALYLGFDRPLPNDLVSLYLGIEEIKGPTPPLVWEAWDGFDWRELQVTDETDGLHRSGMASFIAPDVAPRPEVIVSEAGGTQITVSSALEAAVFERGDRVSIRSNGAEETAVVQRIDANRIRLNTPLADTYTGGTVSLAGLPRFGRPRDWVRARLKAAGAPTESRLNGIHLNAAWANQLQTIESEVLGSGTGQPDQVLFLTQAPVLPGERIEVRELEGARAPVEQPILRQELLERGLAEQDIRTVEDPRTGQVTAVWVRWQSRPHLFFSTPEDRHYVIERARGRLIFGDGRNGRIPPVGSNNILARRYQAGGGPVGNVPAGAITQVLGAAPFAEGVTNPRAADGGAEGEALEAVASRGPQTLRHRGRSLAARDYEALAREATAGVAAVRVLPATAPNGRPAPGWVTVIIVPQSQDPRPQPSFELRRQVHAYLAARAPAALGAGRIAVIGPTYLPIGVIAIIAPQDLGEAGAVERRVRAALLSFLHPLTGGPEGQGWPFGRNVYLSDVAAVVEAVDGVDYAQELNLTLNDTPRGEQVEVPPDRIVVAGTVRVEMKAAEG